MWQNVHWSYGDTTLGVLIDGTESALRALSPESTVYIDTPMGWLMPQRLASYRGFYDHLAIIVARDSEDGLSLGEFFSSLSSANGQTFSAYKGGDYVVGRNTPVWITLGADQTSDLVACSVEVKSHGRGFALVRCGLCEA